MYYREYVYIYLDVYGLELDLTRFVIFLLFYKQSLPIAHWKWASRYI